MSRYRGAVRFFLFSRMNAVTAVALALIYFILLEFSSSLYSSGITIGSQMNPEIQMLISVAIVSVMYPLLEVPSRALFIRSDADFLFSYSLPPGILALSAAVYGSLISIIPASVIGIFLRIFSDSSAPAYATLLFIAVAFLTSAFIIVSSMFRENRDAMAGTLISIVLTLSYLAGNPLSPAAITGNHWQLGLISEFALLALWVFIARRTLRTNSVGMLYFRGRSRRQEIRRPLDFENRQGIRAFRHFVGSIGILASRNGRSFRFRYRTPFLVNLCVIVVFSIIYVFYSAQTVPFLDIVIFLVLYIDSLIASYAIFRLRYERLWVSWMPFSRARGMRAYITSGAFNISRMFAPISILAAVFIIFPTESGTFLITRINAYDAFPLIYVVLAMLPASILSIFLSTIVPPEPVRDDYLTSPSLATGIAATIPVIYVFISAIAGYFINEYVYIYSIAVLAIVSVLVISSTRLMEFSYRRVSSSLYV